MESAIQIIVGGCVKKPGTLRLKSGATVQRAVRAAGGLGAHGMKSTGVITIRSRRKTDGRTYTRRVLNVLRDPSHFSVALRPADSFLVVQFDVASRKVSRTQ